MTEDRKFKKRPCRICRKWFRPDPRVGARQMTCGDKDCQSKWHARKCAEWNQQNSAYFREIYLSKKLAAVDASVGGKHSPSPPSISRDIVVLQSSSFRKLPINLIQEVIGVQPLEYMIRLLLKSFQEVMLAQVVERTAKTRQLPLTSISRVDSPVHAP